MLLLVGICGSPAFTGWAATQTDRSRLAPSTCACSPGRPGGSTRTGRPAGCSPPTLGPCCWWSSRWPCSTCCPPPRWPVPGPVSQFFSGWAAYVLAGGLAAVLAALLGPAPSLLGALQDASTGAGYGFLTGWIIGTASLGGRA
ncbi:hypothetical protein NKG94_38250 [Micromonospora sp. M12]